MLRFRDGICSRTTVDYSVEVSLRSLPQDESSALGSVDIVIGSLAARWSPTRASPTASRHISFLSSSYYLHECIQIVNGTTTSAGQKASIFRFKYHTSTLASRLPECRTPREVKDVDDPGYTAGPATERGVTKIRFCGGQPGGI